MEQQKVNKELYFGASMVYFRECEGEAATFSTDAFEIRKTFTEQEKLRFLPQEHLGDEYKEFVVPGIPAPDILVKEGVTLSDANLPTPIRHPLIKTDTETDVRGYQSGARSAIVHINDKYYRLKGCGNLGQGIVIKRRPLENSSYKGREFDEVRGVMFAQTCFRELYFTGQVEQLLVKHNKPVANRPIGFYQYKLPSDTCTKIKKFCGLFETFSDRRLGDHVIVGLEVLLPTIVKNINREELTSRFPTTRVQDGLLSETWVSLLTEDYENKLNLLQHSGLIHETGSDIGAVPEGVPEQFKTSWESNSKIIKEHLPLSDGVSLLAQIYWRLGYEAGWVQHLLMNNNISWATYEDLLGFHCNAHPNNFVLLPPRENPSATDPFLAPLDFDMAFNISELDESFPAKKEDWMNVEKNSLVLALAGDESLNSGATGFAELDATYTTLKWALRDTLVCGFGAGLKNEADTHPLSEGHLLVTRALLELALIMTSRKIS